MKTSLLSILVPVYNEEKCLTLFYERVLGAVDKIHCEVEFLFINDGSIDNTLFLIKQLQLLDNRVCYLDLSRNYGKEIAVTAGINYIKGDTLVIIDVDLQDPPELIPQMLKEIQNGYDDVYACRLKRSGESWLKKWTAKQYYKYMKILSNIPVLENTGDYRMFSKKAIDALRELQESERNMKGLFSFIGFNKKAIYYNRDQRIAGQTKWDYFKLTNLAIKGFTSFSIIPLRIVSFFGVLISIIAFIYSVIVIIKACVWGDPVAGYPSMMCVILFIGGINLLALGVIGEYLGIIYNETKKRPTYFVKEYVSLLKLVNTN
ncbi:MAG: glycosyltransferase family 2 protein [Tannerellaceae bacterium]|nr:glycosyltransferase family 2 protein [Tannerellaceae bacterium]